MACHVLGIPGMAQPRLFGCCDYPCGSFSSLGIRDRHFEHFNPMIYLNLIEGEDDNPRRGHGNALPTLERIAPIPGEFGRIPMAIPLAGLPWKRVLDLTLVILFLPVLAPLMALIALLIAAVSRGPVLFRQERVGFRGKPFICFKFRTMFVGNDTAAHQEHLVRLMASNHPMLKLDATGDPRIIPFGRFLRACGLDELPQIINVIRGEMSLVGPRPCIPYEYENYLAWQKKRFEALPGITGLWQVSGKNRTSFEQMVRLDIKYARNQTLANDLAILFKTIPVLLSQLWETAARRGFFKRILLSPPCMGWKADIKPTKDLEGEVKV